MTVGERIKRRRKQLGLSVDKLGDLIGKNRATIYRYESDEIENMPYDVVLPISKALNVSPAYLMGWQEEDRQQIATKYPYYPITVAAGIPCEIEGVLGTDVETISVPDTLLGKWAGDKGIFFTRINGDSMNKILPDSSIIAVKKVSLDQLKDYDMVVFSHNHEYSVKRMISLKENNMIIFKPDSTDLRFMDYAVNCDDENLLIHGKVVTYIVGLN